MHRPLSSANRSLLLRRPSSSDSHFLTTATHGARKSGYMVSHDPAWNKMKLTTQITMWFLLLGTTLVQAHENHKHTLDAKGNRAGHATGKAKAKSARSIVGTSAPSFFTKDSDGKAVSLKDLLKRPTVLVFIEKECPCCKGGKPYFDRMQRIYGDVANIVGVVFGDVQSANAWAKETKPRFRVLADPKGVIAKSYRATLGLEARIVDPNGKVALSYAGYSAPMLSEVASHISRVAKIKKRKMDTIPAPKQLTSGCELGEHEKAGGQK